MQPANAAGRLLQGCTRAAPPRSDVILRAAALVRDPDFDPIAGTTSIYTMAECCRAWSCGRRQIGSIEARSGLSGLV